MWSKLLSNLCLAIFFILLTLFLCLLYFKISDCLLDLKAFFRYRSLVCTSFLSSLLNHGLSFFRMVTCLVGIHSRAMFKKVTVNISHKSLTSLSSGRSSYQSVSFIFFKNVSLSILYIHTSLLKVRDIAD